MSKTTSKIKEQLLSCMVFVLGFNSVLKCTGKLLTFDSDIEKLEKDWKDPKKSLRHKVGLTFKALP